MILFVDNRQVTRYCGCESNETRQWRRLFTTFKECPTGKEHKMYIYKTINECEFVDAFDKMDRSDNFTRAARRELFEYYSGMAEADGEPFALDVIAICCDWVEYTAGELVAEYGEPEELDDERYFYRFLEDMRDDTVVIEVEHYVSEPTYLVLAF